MKVKDAMHKGVEWVAPDTPIIELARLMREHDIGAIPIGENDQLIGMVTDRDIVCNGVARESFDPRRATARDVMTEGIHCCSEDDDLTKAVHHMEQLKVRRLPVINKSKRMVGIRVVGEDGEHVTFGAAVVRNLLRAIDALFFYLIGFLFAVTSTRGQRLGDRAAHTIVVRR